MSAALPPLPSDDGDVYDELSSSPHLRRYLLQLTLRHLKLLLVLFVGRVHHVYDDVHHDVTLNHHRYSPACSYFLLQV